MSDNELHRHLIIVSGTATALPYTSTSSGRGGEYTVPARDRVAHAEAIDDQIRSAVEHAAERARGAIVQLRGVALEFIGSEGFELAADKLDDRRSRIEVLSAKEEEGKQVATVFVPEGSLPAFLKKVERYKTEENSRSHKPKNKTLIESIDIVRLPSLRSFWTDLDAFPDSEDEPQWFEVWLRDAPGTAEEEGSLERFRAECSELGLTLDTREIHFPERAVVIVRATVGQLSSARALLGDIAEVRKAKEVPSDYLSLPPRSMAAFVEEAASRIEPPAANAPAVLLLDTGLRGEHPLLRRAVALADIQTVNPQWSAAGTDLHGTWMGGVALFGESLAEHIGGTTRHVLTHRLESVRIFNDGQPNRPETYGAITTEAVALAEVRSPGRKRVNCLAVTANGVDAGRPSSWSAAIDQHASGALDDVRRLYVVAAGNVRDAGYRAAQYPGLSRERCGVEDPGQSWNALTVGACTDRVVISSPGFDGYVAVAPRGGLCPTSRTSVMWGGSEWPLKPDLVVEGGNYAAEHGGPVTQCDDLQILTTTMHPSGRLLETIADTSAATAQVARTAARLQQAYPELWPETVRALLVHSAEWTPQMVAEFPDVPRANVRSRLRCYGYGVPNEQRAFWTVQNAVTLIAQEAISPFKLDGSEAKTSDCHLHDLPWPKDVLESLGNTPVTVRITLSYFVEPSPGRRGWTQKFRYASHGLRFAVRGPTESDAGFQKRITRSEWSEAERAGDENRPETTEHQDWLIGKNTRSRGSLHSDLWTAPAVEVARSGRIAVFPVTGWWRERPNLGHVAKQTRYSLVVTISTPEVGVDLLTPIRTLVRIPA